MMAAHTHHDIVFSSTICSCAALMMPVAVVCCPYQPGVKNNLHFQHRNGRLPTNEAAPDHEQPYIHGSYVITAPQCMRGD